MLLTIIICTYNRADFLKLALQSLVKQSCKDFNVIVIDNNSTDHTKEVCERFCSSVLNLTYFKEQIIGLSHARNRGVREATTQYVGFIDDDCIAFGDWVKQFYYSLDKFNPSIIGGPVLPFYFEKKKWFKDSYHTFEFGEKYRTLTYDETLIGANFIVERSILDQIGFFRTDLGMKGDEILYSEETEFQLRYRKKIPDGEIWYDPNLWVKHFLRPEKMTLYWNIKAFFGKGISNFRKSEYIKSSKFQLSVFLSLSLVFVKVCLLALFGALLRSRKKYPYWQNYFFERLQGNIKKMGSISARLGWV